MTTTYSNCRFCGARFKDSPGGRTVYCPAHRTAESRRKGAKPASYGPGYCVVCAGEPRPGFITSTHTDANGKLVTETRPCYGQAHKTGRARIVIRDNKYKVRYSRNGVQVGADAWGWATKREAREYIDEEIGGVRTPGKVHYMHEPPLRVVVIGDAISIEHPALGVHPPFVETWRIIENRPGAQRVRAGKALYHKRFKSLSAERKRRISAARTQDRRTDGRFK